MQINVGKEVAAMQRMTLKELQNRYAELFGEATKVGNKAWLVKRIGWRLQSLAEGNLSERASRRAAELARDADVRLSPPMLKPSPQAPDRTSTINLARSESRVPIAGTIISRVYKGKTLEVKVLPTGFEFEGVIFKSLSAVAKAVTGQHCSGHAFFHLARKDGGQ